MARCDELLLIVFSVHVIMMFMVRHDSLFHNYLLLEINACYINIFFQIFPGGMPPDPLALACYAC